MPEDILYTHIIKILHLTFTTFLHYLEKPENYQCCQFQWRIACETSETSCKIWGHLNSSGRNPITV